MPVIIMAYLAITSGESLNDRYWNWLGNTITLSTITAICAVAMIVLGITSLFVASDEKNIRLPSRTNLGSLSVPTSDLAAYLLWVLVALVLLYLRLT
jgi:iron(III) transport system permease protein